jgi:ribosomal protein S18 acetylase RimI-like enzyme
MEIRQFVQEDASVYWELRLKALKECPESFGASYEEEVGKPLALIIERLKASIELPDSEFLLGYFDDNQKLLGMIGLFREHRKKMRHKATIYAMYVIPEARARGVGKALVIEALNRARRMKGLEQVNLGVVVSNTEARRLYTRCGFEVYGLEKHALKLDDKYLDEELMVFRL